MNRKEAMVREGIAIAEDDSHGYSQANRWPSQGDDFDCSSFTYTCANRAGYDVPLSGYTGTLKADFEAAGFTAYPYGAVELERGDVLLAHNPDRQHVEIYIGDGQTVGAHSSETGGIYGQMGDQTGNEISIAPNYGGWDWALRPPAEDDGPRQVPGDPKNDAGLLYVAHCADIGWCDPVRDGQVAGTTGYGLRWEALKVTPPEGWQLEIRLHISGVGWKTYKAERGVSDPVMGTVGKAQAIEDVSVRVLKRPKGDKRKLKFRVHQSGLGWKAWTTEGNTSGTDGMGIQLEAIRMVIK